MSGTSGDVTVTAQDQNTVTVGSGLTLDKSYTGNTGGTAPNGSGIAKIGDTLTFTLAYDLAGEPVTNVVLTDVLPAGLDYVDGSATSGDLTFVGYNVGSRTLTWNADGIQSAGSVTYQVTVASNAFEVTQPLTNVATLATEELQPVQDSANVYVQLVESATDVPTVTLPPTDTISGGQAPSNPGFGLMLTLFVLAGIGFAVGSLTPSATPDPPGAHPPAVAGGLSEPNPGSPRPGRGALPSAPRLLLLPTSSRARKCPAEQARWRASFESLRQEPAGKPTGRVPWDPGPSHRDRRRGTQSPARSRRW